MSDIPTTTTPRPRRSTATKPGEQDGPSTAGPQRRNEGDPFLLFGESPSKKGSSSVKYGGKRKTAGSVGTSGSASSPSRPPDSRKESLSARLGISRDTSDSSSAPPISSSKRKNGTTANGSTKKPSSSTQVSNSASTSKAKKPKSLKRNRAAAAISISDDDEEQGRDGSESELSELTTPSSSPIRMIKPSRGQQPPSSTITTISISSSSQPPSPQKPTGKTQKKPTSRKPKPLSKAASWAPSTVNSKVTDIPDTWSLEQLGNHVWVMLGIGPPGGRVLVYQSSENDEKHQADGLQWCWWPAKLKRSKDNLILSPYSLPTSTKNGDLHLPIANASSSNILSFSNQLEHVRFEKLTLLPQNASSISAVQRSPKKKRKLEKSSIEAQFDKALAEALGDEESLNDGVPSLYNALSRGGSFSVSTTDAKGTSSKKGKGKRQEQEISNKDTGDDEGAANGGDEEWEMVVDPGADELLDIPGERVLCRAHKNPNTEYWPAKVVAYVPPPSRIKKKHKGKNQEPNSGKYRMVFLDEGEMEVPREWFYASHEDEFGRCKLGKFQSEFVDNPNEAGDEDDSYSDYDFEGEFDSVSQSYGSASDDSDWFFSLSLSAQFVHVIPVLQAILNDRYPPTRERHEKFMKGGKSRSALAMEEEAGFRGRMNPKDGDVLAKMVQGWCLGSSKDIESAETIADGTVDVIDVDVFEAQAGEGAAGAQQNNAPENASSTEQTTTDDSAMALDAGDTPMDVLDVSYKENVSPHSTLTMDVDTKPQAEEVVATDIHVDPPAGAEASVHAMSPPQSSYPSSSIATPPVELDLDDRPGLAPPLPLLIATQDDAAPKVDEDEDSPLTPIQFFESRQEDIVSAPPAAFEGNGERPRKKRERQVGCESYEALGAVEKVSYTLTILFPIVIRQVLLWRDGSRNRGTPDQLQVLSDEQEWELYRRGEELVRETDWVFDVRRLRESAEKTIQRKEGSGNGVGGNTVSVSTAGRVRRASRKSLRE